uniref:Cd8 beta n=1 Tax=Lepisosteus oculatus TaxID=7918 RepID=W5LZD8_LEPOC
LDPPQLILFLVFLSTAAGKMIKASDIYYVNLFATASISCEWGEKSPSGVFWYRQTEEGFQFLFHYSVTDKYTYGIDAPSEQERFKGSKRDSIKTIFILKILRVQEKDAGIYYCGVLNRTELTLSDGAELRPGETPPTLPPPTTTPRKPTPFRCPSRRRPKPQPGWGCGPLVLWPLAGGLSALAVAWVCTLYYFSRLPKKCRHRFTKRTRELR